MTITLTLSGRITADNAPTLEKSLVEQVRAQPEAQIIFDAKNLLYISSAGLRVLLKVRKLSGKPVQIINVSHDVADILEVTGFAQLFSVRKQLREISVDGCELIGSGGYGKVYRLDAETIAKIYNVGLPLEFVDTERATSQKAFLMGVPTAIAYDTVRCGDAYGVVYEMLNARTVAQIISASPEMIPEVCGNAAELLRTLHEIVPAPDAGLPDRKSQVMGWVNSLGDALTAQELAVLRNFVNAIPDAKTFLHNDFNSKNIMVRDGEFLLIDIGDAATGHPVFDIAGLMLVYIILPNAQGGRYSVQEKRGLLGFDFELAPKVWEVMCGRYFGLKSALEVKQITEKLMPVCLLMMAHQGFRHSGDTPQLIPALMNILRERVIPALSTLPSLSMFQALR